MARQHLVGKALRAASLALCLALNVPTAALAAPSPADVARAEVDAVPTPTIHWAPCDLGECATVALPLDYRNPTGPTVAVAVTRIPSRDPARRIGSLFLNPGGPGASGTSFPQRALEWLGPDVQDRFDLIGMDPRGSNASTDTQCFSTTGRLDKATGTLIGTLFPVGASQEASFLKATHDVAVACSSHGKALTTHVSTAEVARDLDVLRRAVGDERLTFLGFSYGTYLGQVYANMFPGRVRAIAIDGVVDPTAWVGTAATASVPMTVRMDSASASSAALAEILRRCAALGDACALPDPEASFARVANRLRVQPLVMSIPDAGEFTLTYQHFIETVLYALYSDRGGDDIPQLVALLDSLQSQGATPARRTADAASYQKTAARATQRAAGYHNEVEFVPAVMCSDSRNPARGSDWSALADAEDARAPWFGRHWLWGSAYCAGQNWKAFDTDAWTGPFNSVTANPVLVVGNSHDPATSYASAQAVARLLPNSRLLSSTNWGHTAYGVSACATAHVDAYLVDGTLPPAGTLCSDGYEPLRP